MDRTQTAALLTVVASYDRRQLAEPDVLAWHEALSDLPYDLCRQAVAAHYARETVWLMPAHLRRLVSSQRNDAAMRSLPWTEEPRGPRPPWFDAAAAAFAKGDQALGESLLPEHVRDRRYVAQDGAA